MRRFAAKEEERAKRRRKAPQPKGRKERIGLQQFIREVRQELKKVAWPTRTETTTYTVVVLVVTVVLTAFTFGLDFLFKRGVLEMLGA